jgi:hypothetical protein
MATTHSFAILAAVPEMHLLSGVETIGKLENELNETLKLAFGSMDFEALREIDKLRADKTVKVYIYASDPEGDQPLNPAASWEAVYIGHVNSRNGRYPGKSHFRPPATAADKPRWAVFWEIQELKRLKTPIAIASLKAKGKKTNLNPRFIPESPTLIEYL